MLAKMLSIRNSITDSENVKQHIYFERLWWFLTKLNILLTSDAAITQPKYAENFSFLAKNLEATKMNRQSAEDF